MADAGTRRFGAGTAESPPAAPRRMTASPRRVKARTTKAPAPAPDDPSANEGPKPGGLPADPGALARFTAALRTWFRASRRDLPWRHTTDPYAVWLSELMLQQTVAATVVPYWRRFLERFPRVEDLAAAGSQEVLRLWAGLGYYSRARNAHAAAKMVVGRFGGAFPSDPAVLRTLPGVGRYTAGAVAAFAFDRRAAAVDTNVARVVARLFRIGGDPKSPAFQSAAWAAAEALLPERSPGEVTAALMELGATLCSPRGPACLLCPVRDWCEAAGAGSPEKWPAVAPRRAPTPRHEVAVILARVFAGDASADARCEEHPPAAGRSGHEGDRPPGTGGEDFPILLGRRREGEWWAGMWECPRGVVAEGETTEAAALRIARAAVARLPDKDDRDGEVVVTGSRPSIRHGVTTWAITLDVRIAELVVARPTPAGRKGRPGRPTAPDADGGVMPADGGPDRPDTTPYDALRWATPAEAEAMPHSSPQKRVLRSRPRDG